MKVTRGSALFTNKPTRTKVEIVLGGMRRFEVPLVVAASLVFGLLFARPSFRMMNRAGIQNDWDFFTETLWIASRSWSHYHQFPMWDPYRCGGAALFASPFLSLLTPLSILPLVLPPMLGLHLEIPLYLAIGWTGGYFLARVIGRGPIGALACATLFPASSWFFAHFAVGHFSFMPFVYAPWLVALICLAEPHRIIVVSVLGGVVGALTFLESGDEVAMYCAPLLAIVAIWLTVERRQPWPLIALAGTGIFALGFSAVRLLPTLTVVTSRPVKWFEVNSLNTLMHALFSRNQDVHQYLPHITWHFHEYSAYIGFCFPALAVIGVAAHPRTTALWTSAALILFALTAGNFVSWAPWPILHLLPVFVSIRVTGRFLILFTLVVGVIAAFGADSLAGWIRPWGALAALAIILIGAIDLWFVGTRNLWMQAIEIKRDLPDVPFHQWWNRDVNGMLNVTLTNRGAINCYSAIKQAENAIGYNQPHYQGEQHLLGEGHVFLTNWSPNRLEYEADANEPTQLVINQNFDKGWRLAEGSGEVKSFNGLLAVSIPSGKQTLVLTYRPPWLITGSIISALTAIIAALLVILERCGALRFSTGTPSKATPQRAPEAFIPL